MDDRSQAISCCRTMGIGRMKSIGTHDDARKLSSSRSGTATDRSLGLSRPATATRSGGEPEHDLLGR